MTNEEVIKVVEHHKVGKWKKIKAIQYFVGGYSCSICQTFEEQPLEYCKCCGAKMELELQQLKTEREGNQDGKDNED